MAISDEQIAMMSDLFDGLGHITSRKMMGGLMLYCDAQVFALLDSGGTVFLKAKHDFAQSMSDAGARQFSSVNKDGKTNSMGYWTLPEAALDDPEQACDWARRALEQLR